MKTRCHRGGLIVDQTDDLPHKGHMIPDQEWFAIWDAIDDEVIAPVADRRLSKEVAYHLARQIFFRATRLLYQCHTCVSTVPQRQARKLTLLFACERTSQPGDSSESRMTR